MGAHSLSIVFAQRGHPHSHLTPINRAAPCAICTSEVQLDNVEVGDDHRRLRGSFLVVVEPFAAQPFRLIPHLQQILIVLHDDGVLVELSVQVGLGAASRVRYTEGEERLPRRGRYVHAPGIAVLTFRRHYPLERMGKRQVHVHVVFAAHYLYLGKIGGVNGRLGRWNLLISRFHDLSLLPSYRYYEKIPSKQIFYMVKNKRN